MGQRPFARRVVIAGAGAGPRGGLRALNARRAEGSRSRPALCRLEARVGLAACRADVRAWAWGRLASARAARARVCSRHARCEGRVSAIGHRFPAVGLISCRSRRHFRAVWACIEPGRFGCAEAGAHLFHFGLLERAAEASHACGCDGCAARPDAGGCAARPESRCTERPLAVSRAKSKEQGQPVRAVAPSTTSTCNREPSLTTHQSCVVRIQKPLYNWHTHTRSTNATHQCPLSYPSASPRLYPRMSRKPTAHKATDTNTRSRTAPSFLKGDTRATSISAHHYQPSEQARAPS